MIKVGNFIKDIAIQIFFDFVYLHKGWSWYSGLKEERVTCYWKMKVRFWDWNGWIRFVSEYELEFSLCFPC